MSDRRNTLRDTFRELRAQGRIGLLPFVPAGFPDLRTTMLTLAELERAGASAAEVGFPFSDPIADGPVIQEAFTHALAEHVRVADVFGAVREARRQHVAMPLVAMVSFSIVFRYGVERFLNDARESDFDGLILPDLPPPEAEKTCEAVRQAGLETVLLVAPTTPPARREQIVKLCSGFVYYLSVAGTTGERDVLPADLVSNVEQIRAIANCPVCVGFGISKAQHVVLLRGVADGAIVGSALVRRMQQLSRESPETIAIGAGAFCRNLLTQAARQE